MSAGLRAAHHGPSTAAEVAPPVSATSMTPTYRVRALQNLVYTNIGGQPEHLDLYLPTGPTPPGGRPVVLRPARRRLALGPPE